MKRLFVIFIMLVAGMADAGVILQADSVWTDGAPLLPIENIINQSGLSSTYVSGVDDFTTFVNGTTANINNGTSNDLGSNSGQLDDFYFDLGGVFTIDALALWSQTGSGSLETFKIFSSADSLFSTTTFLGSYSIDYGLFGAAEGNILSFTATSAQYFVIDVTSNYGYPLDTRINEVAFSSVTSVPEPSSLLLLGLGMAGLGFARRKKGA